MTTLTLLDPDGLPRPRGFSHGMMAHAGGRLLFVAGQIGCDENGALVSSDLVEQFERALSNVLAVVRAAGGDAASVARITIYVTDAVLYRAHLKGLGQAWRRVMGRHYPAMALLEVKGLFEPSARIELEATAVL